MTSNATSQQNETTGVAYQPETAKGLAIVRLTIGAMFVWVFFENLGKGLYTPGGYASLIRYYIERSHSPAVWKTIMLTGTPVPMCKTRECKNFRRESAQAHWFR